MYYRYNDNKRGKKRIIDKHWICKIIYKKYYKKAEKSIKKEVIKNRRDKK